MSEPQYGYGKLGLDGDYLTVDFEYTDGTAMQWPQGRTVRLPLANIRYVVDGTPMPAIQMSARPEKTQ